MYLDLEVDVRLTAPPPRFFDSEQLGPHSSELVRRGDTCMEFRVLVGHRSLVGQSPSAGSYPKKMPRMRDLKGVGTEAGTAYRPAIFGDASD